MGARLKPRQDTLAFQVDLWNARGALPHDLTDVEVRRKEIVYSSRTRAATNQYKEAQKLRIAMANLIKRLPNEFHDDEDVKIEPFPGNGDCGGRRLSATATMTRKAGKGRNSGHGRIQYDPPRRCANELYS